MANTSKTFRLFISSTFSDFKVEREILQTKVFPEIKKYCSSKSYIFQAIDLRWGVNNEAQLDQKALDMCIKEVQSCKTHNYPNFLIMLGDRYGWIPLPNIIEKNEFELIITNMRVEDIELLEDWYYEDKNQIPISYILKQRVDEYIDDITWLKVEKGLRDILQNAVRNLGDNIKKKYTTSATEAEAIEGIISYSDETPYQEKLLKLLPELSQLDNKHIFGFFRNIDKNTTIKDKFISHDYEKAQEFKEKVKSQLIDENSLNTSTSQISEDKLDESYLEKFTSSIVKFLKRQIDLQMQKDKEKNYSSLEIEKQQQKRFMYQKLENFLGQEKVLNKISNYINDKNAKPLIISGQSGTGKSSIMAKAIEDTLNTSNKKIIYRFVGATPNATNTNDLLTSILEELSIPLLDKKITSLLTEQNEFINVADKFYETITDLADNIIIFIDAVDQLSNDDQFLWIPDKLVSNVKIIVSVLKDRDYKYDSRYFYTLEDKISNNIEIESFDKPLELLECLLKVQNRTIQDEQKKYFLTQYHQVNTPLYVYMATNEMQHWKSDDIVDDNIALSLSQKDIIKYFIKNLTAIHHHDKFLVQKVFGYLLASKDGLSEYEILELLNTDKEFIKQLAPDTWHTNTTQELPLVIWTRLYNHIKPFLSRKNQDGQELLYFFHREFIDVVQNQSNQQREHESIIEATQKLIEINQDKKFDDNRWGKLYVSLLLKYYLFYKYEEKVKQYYDNIISKPPSTEFLIEYFDYIVSISEQFKNKDNILVAEHIQKVMIYLTNKYKLLSEKIYLRYIISIHSQTETLILNQNYSKSIEIEEKNIVEIQKIPNFKNIIKIRKLKDTKYDDKNIDLELKLLYVLFNIKQVLASAYILNKNKVLSMQLSKETYFLLKKFYENNPSHKIIKRLYYEQIVYYSMALELNRVFFEGINLLKESISILEKYCSEDDEDFQLKETYAKSLIIYSSLLFNIKEKNWHEYFVKSYKMYKNIINYDFLRYSEIIIRLNEYQLNLYNESNMFLESEPYYKNNIMLWNRQGKEEVEEKIETLSNELKIKILSLKKKKKKIELFLVNKRLIEYVFNFDKEYWAKKYVHKLIALGSLLNESKIDDNNLSFAEKLQKEGISICEEYMDETDDEWYDLYTKNMNNLANTYSYLNKKDESYVLNKKNLETSTKLFQKNQSKWFKAYYFALNNMADSSFYHGDNFKKKECEDKIKELERNPLFEFQEDVMRNKSTDKKMKYFDYFYKSLLLLGVYFFIKYVFLE